MKITEILTESSQLQEGPILNKIGSGIGKAVGAAAKGVGAVAGGIAGIPGAIKKGFKAGKATVGGAGDEPTDATAKPADTTKPAAGSGGPNVAADLAKELGKKAYKGATGYEIPKGADPAKATASGAGGTAAAPAAKTAAAPAAADTGGRIEPTLDPATPPAKAGAAPAASTKQDTAYAQAQKAVAGLAPEQKKEIVTMLQADPKVKAAMTAKPKAPAAKQPAGAGAMGAMANTLTGKENPAAGQATSSTGGTTTKAPGVTTHKANPDNPNAAAPAAQPAAEPAPAAEPDAPTAEPKRTGGKVAGQVSQTPNAIRKREARAKAKQQAQAQSQAEIDADRERMMGNFTDSLNRHKKAMTEGAFRTGALSLFRKV